MGDNELPIHEICTRHDGQESKMKIIIWLLGLLIAILLSIGGALYANLTDIKSQVSVLNSRLQTFEGADSRLDSRLNQLESRLRDLEMERRK